jgi:uncharacterized lipoprotein YddW (UPF0748 family)
MDRRTCAVFAIIALPTTACAQPYAVGVFDCALTGGTGASSAGFLKAFDDLPEYEAQPLSTLDLSALCRQDIVILYDMHQPGRVSDGWQGNLQRYVQAGGSVLSTYHQHLFPEIGPGVLKVYVPEVRPVGQSALVAGISPFKTDWPDHIILAPGPSAQVFLENTEGKPVAACGTIGKGKLIDCGLALGIKQDWQSSKPPTGMERKLLENMLAWLQPQERWPIRLAALVTQPDFESWIDGKLIRQPQPVAIRVQGLLPKVDQPVSVEASVVDSAGRKTSATDELRAEQAPGADIGLVEATVRAPTEGLASGEATVTYEIKAPDRRIHAERLVRLVRATPPEEEFRGFWIHAIADRLPADIMPRIRACGFNAVIPRVSGGTGAFYLSKVLPDVQNILGEEDWLANCVRHAHANGLQVYPYRNCFIMEGRASKETIAAFRAAGRLQVSPEGRPIDWMCPSQEVNRAVEIAAATEIVGDYDVDGFQFDFIRYPNASGCFCDRCRAKFEGELGAPVERWPQDVIEGGKLFERYTRFRQAQITETVRAVSEAIRRTKPKVRISAAVFSNYASDSVTVGQDWVTWAQKGYVDFLCPMDYTADVQRLDGWVRDQVARVGDKTPVCAGLALSASGAKMATPEDLALQIDIARQAGAKGIVLFAWYPGCDEKIVLPQREDSLAGTPSIPWKG